MRCASVTITRHRVRSKLTTQSESTVEHTTRSFTETQPIKHSEDLTRRRATMLKLMLVILFPLAISFGCGYGLRDWISRRRRKEVRKKFYDRYRVPHAKTPAPKAEIMASPARREFTIRELDERLSKLEDRLADTRSGIEAFRDEVRSEFAATRELLEREFEEGSSARPLMQSRAPNRA
jgi:hypothetical protein